jgi:hypothetical protein
MRNILGWATLVLIAMVLTCAFILSISVVSISIFGYTEIANCFSICIFLVLYGFAHKKVYFP